MKPLPRCLLLIVTVLLSLPALATAGVAGDEAAAPGAATRQRVHAFYYPWYGAPPHEPQFFHWTQGGNQPPAQLAADYWPVLGPYSSSDPAVIEQHCQWATEAGIGVLVTSWWGRDSFEERQTPALLAAAHRHGLTVAFHLEPYHQSTPATFAEDVRYLLATYGDHPAFHRVAELGDRPVFYVFESLKHDAATWRQAIDALARDSAGRDRPLWFAQTTNVQVVVEGGFDGAYPYDIVPWFSRPDYPAYLRMLHERFQEAGKLLIPSVGPGYLDDRAVPHGLDEPPAARTRDDGSGSTYERAWHTVAELHSPWVSLTSFNEWHEGSQIEPARAHQVEGETYHGYRDGPRMYLTMTRAGVLQLESAALLREETSAAAMPSGLPARTPEETLETAFDAALERLVERAAPQRLPRLRTAEILPLLTPDLRQTLATGLVHLEIDRPATLWLLTDTATADDPFWLAEQGFEARPERVQAGSKTLALWQKSVPAGPVHLGVSALRGSAYPYAAVLAPAEGSEPLRVRVRSPRWLRQTALEPGAAPWHDRDHRLEALPPVLTGPNRILLQTSRRQTRRLTLLDRFRTTDFPATATPDQIVLTWSDDPHTTQTLQWRTSDPVTDTRVEYQPVDAAGQPTGPLQHARGDSQLLRTPEILGDPRTRRHHATLTGLQPDHRYTYRVGSGQEGHWSEKFHFRTAPAGTPDFSFIYLGDAQNGLDAWGQLLRQAHTRHPEAAFYLLPGDLVDRGADRDDWDTFFHHAHPVFAEKTFMPALGNHEYLRHREPRLYLAFFRLPGNGPAELARGKAYAFDHGPARFIVLDSNDDPQKQAAWLEAQLAGSPARWHVVLFHHPIVASHPRRNHQPLEQAWGPIFDRYGVDLVLQGHDHAYLRTHPLRGGQRVAPGEGTHYVVAVAGTKFYEQRQRPETAVGLENTRTYQHLAVQGDRLHYRAFDVAGTLVDELVLRARR